MAIPATRPPGDDDPDGGRCANMDDRIASDEAERADTTELLAVASEASVANDMAYVASMVQARSLVTRQGAVSISNGPHTRQTEHVPFPATENVPSSHGRMISVPLHRNPASQSVHGRSSVSVQCVVWLAVHPEQGRHCVWPGSDW